MAGTKKRPGFTIRGYAAKMRGVNKRKSWVFAGDGEEGAKRYWPLPPMEISKPAVWWADEFARIKNKPVVAAGPKVCPVCSTFTATTTTAMNAHIDACLAVKHPQQTQRKRGRPPTKKRSIAELIAASPPGVSLVNEQLNINQDTQPEKDINMNPYRQSCTNVKEAVDKTKRLTEPIKEQVEIEESPTYSSGMLRNVPLKRRKKYKVLATITSHRERRTRPHLLTKRKQFLRTHRNRLLAKLFMKKSLVSRRKSILLSMLKVSVDNCQEKSREREENKRVSISDKSETLQQTIEPASPSSVFPQIQPNDEADHAAIFDTNVLATKPMEGTVDSNQVFPTANDGNMQCEPLSQGLEATAPTIPKSYCPVPAMEISSTETYLSPSWAVYRPQPRRFLAGGVDVAPDYCFSESSHYSSIQPSNNSCIFSFQPCAVYDGRQMNEGWIGLPLNSQGEVLYSFYPGVMTRINCLHENQYGTRLVACSSAYNPFLYRCFHRIDQSNLIDINQGSQCYDGQAVNGLINLQTTENSNQYEELNSDVHTNNGNHVVQNRLPARDSEMQCAAVGNQEQTVRLMGKNLTVNHCNEGNLSRDGRSTTENCFRRVHFLENSMSRHCLQEASGRLQLASVKFIGSGSNTSTSTAVPFGLDSNYVARGNFSSQNQEFSHQLAVNHSQGHEFQESSERLIDPREIPPLRSQCGDQRKAVGKQLDYAQAISENLPQRPVDAAKQKEETNIGCPTLPPSPRASTPSSLPVQSPYWAAHGIRSDSNTWSRVMSNNIAKNSRSVSYRNLGARTSPKLADKPDELACTSMESTPSSGIDLNVDFKMFNAEQII